MKSFTVTITDEQEKALLTDMISIQEWLENAIYNKARQCIDKIVTEFSNFQPDKLDVATKEAIVQDADVVFAVDQPPKDV